MNPQPLKVLFAGTPEFAAKHLLAIIESTHEVIGVVTQPDKPGKRGRVPVASSVKHVALDHALTVLQPDRLSAGDLSGFNPDVLVVVAYGQILRAEVLALPRLGCVNVHASLLPRWRGAAPIQRAILEGDHRTGICTMQMDQGLDTGDVLVRREIDIDPDDTAESLSDRLSRLGCDALLETLSLISLEKALPIAQSNEGITYASKIDKSEAEIDWSQSAERIERQVRAFNPDPIAYSYLGDMRVRFWRARVATGKGSPGEILALAKTGLEIACGSGSIVVERLQLPVGKGTIISATDLMNAGRAELSPGKRFGQ
jgi:methionyl-tRNA formyltransferase